MYFGDISQQTEMYFPGAPNNEKVILHILHITEFHLAHKHTDNNIEMRYSNWCTSFGRKHQPLSPLQVNLDNAPDVKQSSYIIQ